MEQEKASSAGPTPPESISTSFFRKARERPDLILSDFVALLNGYWQKLKFKLFFKDVRIGGGFRVYGRMRVVGPGKARIGQN